jgi:hypothetical protein
MENVLIRRGGTGEKIMDENGRIKHEQLIMTDEKTVE